MDAQEQEIRSGPLPRDPRDLFVPPDVFQDDESETSAYCGPCAIAALLGITLQAVRDSGTPLYKSMNPTQARTALVWLGRSLVGLHEPEAAGLAHVFWLGPWSAASPRVQYTKSHWIAYRSVAGILFVYDVNTDGWLPLATWEAEVVPRLLPRKGTGYRVNRWLELDI